MHAATRVQRASITLSLLLAAWLATACRLAPKPSNPLGASAPPCAGPSPLATEHIPSDAVGQNAIALTEVETWAYQLQGLSEPGAVEELAASDYDLLVLEPTRTDWSSSDRCFDAAAMVRRLQRSPAGDGSHRKLAIAYLNVGQAEDWRWYWTWSRGWNCRGDPPVDWPTFILACDPDGWGGNYPVATWDPGWRSMLIYGDATRDPNAAQRRYASALDEVLRDGFDGVYLDWVAGYEDPAVIAAAQAAGRDPAAETVALIAEINAYARQRDPDFIIIQQNAADLARLQPDILGLVDAIVQEAVWFDGVATDRWHDPRNADRAQDTALTDELIASLGRYQAAGRPVFVCEYAVREAETAYARAQAHGYIAYVSRTPLSRLSTTPPPD